ncbi:MAG TPA: glycoside hydrolase family 16 protein [Planctomycetota bacterium]|nr:glycoside hydrolase family 16 protein [Planctomycetota bacterium]
MPVLAALLLSLAVQDPLPKGAELALDETWSGGRIEPDRWYLPRKRWGQGNNGVIPENVRVEKEGDHFVLVCEAHGDQYDGAATGFDGAKPRVGGVAVSKRFFASGRFEVRVRIGSTQSHDGGPGDPKRPAGAVPAIWTYAYRAGPPELLSELDFPEFGKGGNFAKGLYNAYCQTKEDTSELDVAAVMDGAFHTLTTEWRTALEPLDGIADGQVVEQSGFWWIRDKAVPFERYFGNPLKRLEKDKYSVHRGVKAVHWIDGKKVGENTRAIPCMAAQLTLGVWLPAWGGPAAWKMSTVTFGPIKVWQYHDPGDVGGILMDDLKDNFH